MHAILLYFLNLFRPYPQKMTVLFLQKEALCLAAFAKGRSETYEIQRYAAAALPPPLSGKKRWMIRVPWRRLFGKSGLKRFNV